MSANKIDLPKFKRFCAEHAGLAEAVVMAQAFAEIERARVNAYVLPIFSEYEFFTDLAAKHGQELERITNPGDLYLSQNEELAADFYAACDHAHREHGFKGPSGHCPALTAENLKITAEEHLVKAGAKFFGIEDALPYGEERKKFLDLLMGACLKAAKERIAGGVQ